MKISELSQAAQDWLNARKADLADRIDSYHSLPDNEEKAEGLPAYIDWPPSAQAEWGYPSGIHSDVDDAWHEIKTKTRNELGGKPGAAGFRPRQWS